MMGIHSLGTAGSTQAAGSVLEALMAGMTMVPAGVTTSVNAYTAATGPPQTRPSELRDTCTSTDVPSSRRSCAKLSRVRGSVHGAIASRSAAMSPTSPARCTAIPQYEEPGHIQRDGELAGLVRTGR